jgi:hypothetical protein
MLFALLAMKRIVDNLHIDVIAAGLMVGLITTGYVLRFPLPPGSNKSLVLWGLTRHEWGDIHFWIGAGLLAVVLLHVCLHWQWVHISVKRLFSQAKARGTRSLASGLTTLVGFVLIFALFAWAAQNGVKPMEDRPDGVCPTSKNDVAENPPGERGNTLENFSNVAQTQFTFRKDVYPIFERACVSCHGPKTQRANFRIDRKDDFARESGGTPLVVPGESAQSSLVSIASGLRKDIARPDVHRLPADQVAVLKAWIDAGARWDSDVAPSSLRPDTDSD